MTTVIQKRSTKPGRGRLPISIAGTLAIAAVLAVTIPQLLNRTADPLAGGQIVAVTRDDLTNGISATGAVAPRLATELGFALASGRVSEVLVREGDAVQPGQPLVRLDAREATAQLAQANAAVQAAEADLARLREGATAAETQRAEAQLAEARGALTQTEGSVTSADIAAARAAVTDARARLAVLNGNPNADDLAAARATLVEAQQTLARQQAQLSSAKLAAERLVDQRANALRDAQTAFAAARDNNTRAQDDENDPITGAPLTDAGKEAYANALITAERAMQDADAALAQARVDLEAARTDEIAGLGEAQARITTAQANVTALLNPNADALATARATLAQAEANQAKLQGAQRTGALRASQAQVAQAEANLADLLADARTSELVRAQALVAQAEAQRTLAQIRLDDTTLSAPFAGIVAQIDLTPGERIGTDAALTLVDVARFTIKIVVDEVDVARVNVGQQVNVLIDALGAPELRGSVTRIATQSSSNGGVTSYEIDVEVDPSGRAVRAGMTATATIVTATASAALSIPNAAVRTVDGVSTVTIVTTVDGQQTISDRQVQIGERFGDRIVIASGLNAGDQIVVGP